MKTDFKGNEAGVLGTLDLPPAPPSEGDGPFDNEYCKAGSDGQYSTEIRNKKSGEGQDGDQDYVWGEGGGCALRPLRETWAVSMNQALMVFGGVTRSENKRIPSPSNPEVNYQFEVKYYVDNPWPKPDIDWTMQWFHAATPRRIKINYAKTDGTGFIPYWQGSIVLDFVTPKVTSVIVRDQIKARTVGPEKALGTVEDIISKLQTGQPDWSVLNP